MSLSDAILQQDSAGIRQCLLSGVDVNALDEYGFTPLIEAAIMDDVDTSHQLIVNGADVNLQDATGNVALHWAAENNNVHLAKLLLEHGANPNVVSFSSKPVLLMPYLRRQSAMKTLLYQYGADLRFCQDFINAKLLGHRFELVGHADLVDRQGKFHEVNFEGFFLEFTLSVMAQSLEDFARHFASRWLRGYHDGVYAIIGALQRATELVRYQQYRLTVADHWPAIEKRLHLPTVIVPVGIDGHALTFIKHRDTWIRCDRQDNAAIEDTLSCYTMRANEEMQVAVMKRLLYQKNSPEVLNEPLEKALGLTKIDALPMPLQRSGNCSWANVEAVIPALLTALFVDQGDARSVAKHKAMTIFREWRQWDQQRDLHFCVESFKNAETTRRATKAELLGAVLFQALDPTVPDDVTRATQLLAVLANARFDYILRHYLKTYCFDTVTDAGQRFKDLLRVCGYQF